MCDDFGFPLALIFEELLTDKAPKEDEDEQEEEQREGNG